MEPMMFSFTAKDGTVVHVPEEEISGMSMDDVGYCIECGTERYNTEPDARNYPCDDEDCGKKAVFGAQELLMMGLIG
jgi:hypothetical protein|tara:strand:+ start:292 stop:522 length:231 start_codon:yes stop_codon:yes gene_type:complete